MKQRIKRFGILALVLSFFVSCTSEYIGLDRQVCYEEEVAPLIISTCTRSECHNPADKAGGYDLTDFNELLSIVKPGDYAGSELYKVITNAFSPMPPDPFDRLTKSEILTLSLWIEQGAQKDVVCNLPPCDTAEVGFNKTIVPILNTYCNGCHAGNQPQGGVNYNSYSGVKQTVTDNTLLGSIRRQSGYIFMPKNGNPLPACQVLQIEKWISEGAKNN